MAVAGRCGMKLEDLKTLERLLTEFRDDSGDREEYDKRESVRFDVGFEIMAIESVKQCPPQLNSPVSVNG